MKVRTLIEFLNTCNPNTEVVAVIGSKKQETKVRVVNKVTNNKDFLVDKTTILHLSTKDGYVDKWGMATPYLTVATCAQCNKDYEELSYIYEAIQLSNRKHYCNPKCFKESNK